RVLATWGVAVLWLSRVLGAVGGPRPGLRRPIGMTLAPLLGLCWLAMTAWPGEPPVPLVVVVIAVSAAAAVMAPALSFDFARDGMPPERTGVASGLVNMSGFTTTDRQGVGEGK